MYLIGLRFILFTYESLTTDVNVIRQRWCHLNDDEGNEGASFIGTFLGQLGMDVRRKREDTAPCVCEVLLMDLFRTYLWTSWYRLGVADHPILYRFFVHFPYFLCFYKTGLYEDFHYYIMNIVFVLNALHGN